MRVYTFAAVKGKHISAFDSEGATITSVTQGPRSHQIAALHLEPNGKLGSHKAISDQLLIVASGVAQVTTTSGQSTTSLALGAGEAILWRTGEVHEIRAGDAGLLGILVEGDKLSRFVTMPTRRF